MNLSKLISIFSLVATLAGVDVTKINIVLAILKLVSSGTASFSSIAEHLETLFLPAMSGDDAEKLKVGIQILKVLGEEA